jgi:hypothetical protein
MVVESNVMMTVLPLLQRVKYSANFSSIINSFLIKFKF